MKEVLILTLTPQQPERSIIDDIEPNNYPTRTYRLDKKTMRLNGESDTLEAMKQAVEIYLNTGRYEWQIYSPDIGVELENLLGKEYSYVISEIKRRIGDALSIDERITDVIDYNFVKNGENLSVSFSVKTVYGTLYANWEVLV